MFATFKVEVKDDWERGKGESCSYCLRDCFGRKYCRFSYMNPTDRKDFEEKCTEENCPLEQDIGRTVYKIYAEYDGDYKRNYHFCDNNWVLYKYAEDEINGRRNARLFVRKMKMTKGDYNHLGRRVFYNEENAEKQINNILEYVRNGGKYKHGKELPKIEQTNRTDSKSTQEKQQDLSVTISQSKR